MRTGRSVWTLWVVGSITAGWLSLAAAPARSQEGASASAAEKRERSALLEDPANLQRERPRASTTGTPLPADRGASGVAAGLKRLRTRASLLMIVAHPDDEDGGMLTYESRGQGARVGMLTLTRGEGGQNVMSGDFNDALGLVRTRELLAADQYMGVDQMFGTEVDFGFSKTKEEAFSQWTHERVLYDAVRAVRLYRPLVVTSVFLGAPTDGHGQHQVSGEIAQEAFIAAGDPKIFPEMGLPAWSPAKVYARVPFARVDARGMFDYAIGKFVPVRFENYVTKRISTEAPRATVTIPEGEFSSLLGKSYVQFAREGLALQRTQIDSGVRLAPAGRFDVGYTRYGTHTGVAPKDSEQSFFDGVDTSLAGIAELVKTPQPFLRGDLLSIQETVERAQREFSAATPGRSAPALREGLVKTRALIARIEGAQLQSIDRFNVLHELRIKEAQFQETLAAALGVIVRAQVVREATAVGDILPVAQQVGDTPQRAVRGQKVEVEVEVTNGSDERLGVTDETARYARGLTVSRDRVTSTAQADLKARGVHDEILTVHVGRDAPYTLPYFSRLNIEQPYYDLHDPSLRNAPTTPPALTVWETIHYGDVPLTVGAVVEVRPRPESHGEVAQPLMIVPALSVAMEPAVSIVPDERRDVVLTVRVRAEDNEGNSGSVHLQAPGGWELQPAELPFSAEAEDGSKPLQFVARTTRDAKDSVAIDAVASVRDLSFNGGFAPVGYPGITHDNIYAPAQTKVRSLSLKIPAGLSVAYLPGTGDAVEASFAEMGITARRISVAAIAAGKLTGFDALVMGVRAYAAHPDLKAVTAQLTKYAAAGGVVVVQYNTSEYDTTDAPYPLSLGAAEKVVEENAPVRFPVPGEQALSWPNRLTPHDFDGWVEERGHGFAEQWAPEYRALTEVRDAGQDPQRGGLLVAPVGKGSYVYCAYALYRQLPEGVPGAFRILANLVSLGRKP